MTTFNVRRGFHRIGIVLAVFTSLISCGLLLTLEDADPTREPDDTSFFAIAFAAVVVGFLAYSFAGFLGWMVVGFLEPPP